MALLQRIRHERIVRIDSMTEVEALSLGDDAPGPERRVSARFELERVRRLIAVLPERCREIFELRRVKGVPQHEIAEALGILEHIVIHSAGPETVTRAKAGPGKPRKIRRKQATAFAFGNSAERRFGVTESGDRIV